MYALLKEYYFACRGKLAPDYTGVFLGLCFVPEDGDDMFFRNVVLSPNYMALQFHDHCRMNLKSDIFTRYRVNPSCNGLMGGRGGCPLLPMPPIIE
jgi:hypothetical protein